jgi:4-carboxymuconolactone decarboxylase
MPPRRQRPRQRPGGALAARSSPSSPARAPPGIHPLGQTLIITSGCGWVQTEGGPRDEVHPGDIVWIPPGEKHWHGATATIEMTHVVIAEALDGKTVDWMEHVTDEEYGR